jgi:hypothetical protein
LFGCFFPPCLIFFSSLDAYDISTGSKVVSNLIDPTTIEAGFVLDNVFFGVGLESGPMRTVVKWTIDSALKSTHTVLGNLPGYFIINSGAATWDSSSRTLFTQLMPRNSTKSVDLLEIEIATDDKITLKHVVQPFCGLGTCPFEMKYLN